MPLAFSIGALETPGDRTINENESRGVVILVEPDESVREALTVLLEGEGWAVRPLVDCATLTQALERSRILAVVSESRVPDCEPQEILDLCIARAMPVIFTGHDMPLQEAVDLIRQGATDFLDKPFPQARLLDLLERLHSGQND
jgi:DNA-binding NtrC family response regulator